MLLTSEVKDRLCGYMGFDVEATFKYVLKVFRDKDNPIPKELWSIFTLKSKNGVELANVEDNMGFMTYEEGKAMQMQLKSGSMRMQTLEIGIKGVSNYTFEDGTTLDWDSLTRKATFTKHDGKKKVIGHTVLEIIKYLPVKTQMELQNAINERTLLTEEELQGLI